MGSPAVKMPIYLCLSQCFPDRFAPPPPIKTFVKILDEYMLGNIALDNYLRDGWSFTQNNVKDKVIINALVSILMCGNIGLTKAKIITVVGESNILKMAAQVIPDFAPLT